MSSQISISIKNIVYSFNRKSIPIGAVFTNNYILFREIILEHGNEINTQLIKLMRKLELETNILNSNPELNDRNRAEIQNFIVKLKSDIDVLINLMNDFQTLKNNEKIMKKLFYNIHGKINKKPLTSDDTRNCDS